MRPERAAAIRATQTAMQMAPILEKMGLEQGTMGFNRLMANLIDLQEDALPVYQRFVANLPKMKEATIEEIGRLRADSFFDEESGQWQYNRRTFKNYADLLADQTLRAASFDFGGRIG